MGENLLYIDILIFAMIAAFLVFRLRSVLGRRTGHERQRPNPFRTPPEATKREPAEPDNVVLLPDPRRADTAREPASAAGTGPAGLTQIRIADPSFEPRAFLKGAQAAFGMIVEAFARGDTAALRPLLGDDLYDAFSGAIRARLAAGETLETRIEDMKEAEIVEGRMDGRTALVTVRFVTRQINVTRDADGRVADGQAAESADPAPVEITDLWTFARNTRSADPNWTLVETSTPP